MNYIVNVGGVETPVTVRRRDDGRYEVGLSGETVVVDARSSGELHSLMVGAKSVEAQGRPEEGPWRLVLRGRTLQVGVESEQERNARAVAGAGGASRPSVVKASMPGFVSKVLVRVGDKVAKGTPVAIIEAMKMENEIRAESSGVVKDVKVADRQTVNGGDVLLVIGEG
jgi:pyruvate carboxylase subunit B